MKKLIISPDDKDNDYYGNNAAFTCPVCSKVFIVSGFLNSSGRKCPGCGKATGYVKGSQSSQGTAFIEFND